MKPNIQLTLSGAQIVIDDRIEEKAESSQATKKFDWRVGEMENKTYGRNSSY